MTGGTGRVGGQVVAQLAGAGDVRVRVLSRDPARASAVLGPRVEVVGGDLARPDTLGGALDG
ncbi:SDR family oxidoreductase, partial [Micromonospora zhanjiangensis]